MVRVNFITVNEDDNGIRLDRWLGRYYPGFGFGLTQKLIRTGQVRVDGHRVKVGFRLSAGVIVRIPPAEVDKVAAKTTVPTPSITGDQDLEGLKILHQDDGLLIFNKPPGLAVQGGTGTTIHVDGILDRLRNAQGIKPRLVHRLDKETSGILMVAKSRIMAKEMARLLRMRKVDKFYWALVYGGPKLPSGKISTFLGKGDGKNPGGHGKSYIAEHGDPGAQHSLTWYRVVERAGKRFSWLAFRLFTGRTHQIRAHAAYIGSPIVGERKYHDKSNYEIASGLPNHLHLMARRIIFPHPDGGVIDVCAPLPEHMKQSWDMLDFSLDSGDLAIEQLTRGA